jgi:hypothetical protein
MNEAQRFPSRAYVYLRAPLADTAGLGIVVSNPPDVPSGRWVLQAYESAKAGIDTWKLFEFETRKNPFVDWASLESMKDEPMISDEDFRREVLGEFIPIGDLVWHAWSAKHNIQLIPDVGRHATREFTKEKLGRDYVDILTADFQTTPHMIALRWRVWKVNGVWLCWIVSEYLVEKGDEDDLIDVLEANDLDPHTTAIVGDASGEWQDAKRTKGGGSFDVFRSRGWRHLYLPDEHSKRNPDILSTVRIGNALMKNAAGERRLFSSPSNVHTNRAIQEWENRHGFPSKRSEFAHIGDCIRYFAWRFFKRSPGESEFSFDKIDIGGGQRARDLDL